MIEKFKDIQSLYEYLEENAIDYYIRSKQIADLFRDLRDTNSVDLSIIQWEIDCFNFVTTEGELKPSGIFTNEKGDTIEYPNLASFDKNAYGYFVERLNSTTNHLLKSRYAHILWYSPIKHGLYAQMAVDSYLKLSEACEAKDRCNPKEHYGLYVLLAIKNAYYIARQVNDKYRSNMVKSKIKSLIFHFNDNSSSYFTLKTDLIELMVNERDAFDDKDFVSINHKCLQLTEELSKLGDIYRIVLLYQFGEKIDELLMEKTCDWRLCIARHYESLMKRNETEPLTAVNYCLQALECFKELKAPSKVKELEDKYKVLKSSIRLETIEYKVDKTDFREKCIKLTKEIADNPPESIIGYLLFSNHLLPAYEYLEKQVEQQSKDFPLQNLFPSTILDQNIHPAQKPDGNNVKYHHIIDNYRISIETIYLYFINHIFIEAIKARKLSLTSLITFFKDISWFGTPIFKPMPDGNYREFDWLSLIAPALNEYFLQMEYFLSSGKIPNYILAIDSLTLKIEGILRDFCEFSDITTFSTRREKTGIIVREKDVNALLHDTKLKEILGNDNILLLRFLLVEKGGYNLRHNVAHSLMTYWEYNINQIHLLILILLKLSKYDFIKRNYLFCLNQP